MESSHKYNEVNLSKVVIILNYCRIFQVLLAYFQKYYEFQPQLLKLSPNSREVRVLLDVLGVA